MESAADQPYSGAEYTGAADHGLLQTVLAAVRSFVVVAKHVVETDLVLAKLVSAAHGPALPVEPGRRRALALRNV